MEEFLRAIETSEFVEDRFIREAETCEITGLSRTTLWRLEKAGDFVKRYRLGPNSIGRKHSELMAWMKTREAVR